MASKAGTLSRREKWKREPLVQGKEQRDPQIQYVRKRKPGQDSASVRSVSTSKQSLLRSTGTATDGPIPARHTSPRRSPLLPAAHMHALAPRPGGHPCPKQRSYRPEPRIILVLATAPAPAPVRSAAESDKDAGEVTAKPRTRPHS